MIKSDELKDFLEFKFHQYNTSKFIVEDPISIPHQFSKKQDIEIAAFLAAILAWGNRKTIIRNANSLLELMDLSPYDYILNSESKDLSVFENFKHRTFNGFDCLVFINSLKRIYQLYDSMDDCFADLKHQFGDIPQILSNFKILFFKDQLDIRTTKHLADPLKGSAAKRLNMFLRWMVRKDTVGVDFGIWKSLKPSELYCPLDAHTSRVSRKLGLLKRTQNDWKSVAELTQRLKEFDQVDPIKYDFALFGLGIYENF